MIHKHIIVLTNGHKGGFLLYSVDVICNIFCFSTDGSRDNFSLIETNFLFNLIAGIHFGHNG